MGFINIPASSSLGSIFHIFFPFFFFSANMNLTVFAGILHAITMATARRASLGEKTMQAAGKADEPVAMRDAARPASLVEKIMRAANEADEPDKAKRVKTRGYQSAVVTYIQKEANFTTSNRAADHFHPLIGSGNANCLMRFDGHCTKNEQCCSRRCNVIAGKRGKQWLYRCDHYNGL